VTPPLKALAVACHFSGGITVLGLTVLRIWGDVLGFGAMELNQIKRFIKDLEERTDSLRRYL